nr:polyprenyl synthetase family protein [Psychrobacter sp. PraFG1]UTT87678.1 polyprenyl synthetase family protein [Psychrobacter sp. PraFG1]
MLDLNAENKQVSQPQLEAIHRDKTGALIEAAVLMGAACADANDTQYQALTSFATNVGLAFQVQDDILDVTSSTDTLGKPTGSDEGLNKSTYVKLMGVEAATDYAKSLFLAANQAIDDNFDKNSSLIDLAQWLWQRQK